MKRIESRPGKMPPLFIEGEFFLIRDWGRARETAMQMPYNIRLFDHQTGYWVTDNKQETSIWVYR